MGNTAVLPRESSAGFAFQANAPACTAVVAIGVVKGFWPVVKMSDGTLRKGPFAEIVGRWSNDG